MTTLARGRYAQIYEKGIWEDVSHQGNRGESAGIDFYAWRAAKLQSTLRRLGHTQLTQGNGRIVEVGSGPVGMVAYLPGAERIAVDPLNGFYAEDPDLVALRDPEVRYLNGVGEAIPAEAGRYDLVIAENCIDHVRDVSVVMKEMRRVLRDGGILYLTVNARTAWGYGVHRILSALRIDPGHAHTLTAHGVRRLIRRHGFTSLEVRVGSYRDAWKKDLLAAEVRPLAKALLGVSEYVVTVCGRKVGDADGESTFQ